MGGIIRDSSRNVIMAFASPLYPCKVIFAELMGLAKGLEICQIRGFVNVQIEVDAMLLIQIIKNDNVFYHQFFYLIRRIRMAISNLSCSINHILREGNACADWLTKFGCNLENDMEFGNDNLPRLLTGLIKLDKIGMFYIRLC
ncbi:Putative ribonuclease H protein [Dendrobium catenatum]|uniref:Ribonuclease H protein n=1 Tax=Dendrobium catenatum TaxID=906689 RepID=A0A2I0VZ89_9ASPA|nr:Putative ribonuclease H protein [Dendrobium catenatum]